MGRAGGLGTPMDCSTLDLIAEDDFDSEAEECAAPEEAAAAVKVESFDSGLSTSAASSSDPLQQSAGSDIDLASIEQEDFAWVFRQAFVKPLADMKARMRLYAIALLHVESKPPKMCNHLTCMLKKAGKAAWCATHRKVYDNGKSDAERQATLPQFQQLGMRCCQAMAIFMDTYVLTIGLPGQRSCKAAGDFDWQMFISERVSSSSVADVARVRKLDHVGWVKYMITERLKTKAKAESEWFAAVEDLQKYPGRDFQGPGECPDTLGCLRAECAGGLLRIHLACEAFVDAATTKLTAHRSQVGTKRRKKFKDDDVAAADGKLDFGHHRFSSSQYKGFSKALINIDNSFSQALPPGEEMPAEDSEPKPKKGRKATSGGGDGGAGPSAAANGSGGSGGGLGGTPSKSKVADTIADAIDDAHTSAEKEVRWALGALTNAIATARKQLREVPNESHTERLRASLDLRVGAARMWTRDSEEVAAWVVTYGKKDDLIAADGSLTEAGENEFDNKASSAMKELCQSLVDSELKDILPKKLLCDKASQFAEVVEDHESLTARKDEFGKQVDLVKDMSRLII